MRAIVLVLLLIGTPLQARTQAEMNDRQLPDSLALVQPRLRLADVERRLAREPHDAALHMERLGALYLVAVEDDSLVDVGLRAVDSLRAAPGDPQTPRLEGYDGAFTVLRAKHAFWPHHKLAHVRSGLATLDAAVTASPEDALLRYLRLMSGFYLPGLFGRGDEVAADFAALARLLPGATADFPGPMLGTVTRFVLENGEVPPRRADALQALLELHE